MKKRVLTVSLLSFVCFFTYARSFFDERYFEIQIKAPFGFSTNAISLDSILKEELVIDLEKLSKKVPKSGYIIATNISPSFGINLNLPKVSVGFDTGVEFSGRYSVSKDFFTLLGEGYQCGDEVNAKFHSDMDVFYNFNVDVGIDVREYTFHIKPTLFVPLIGSASDIGDLQFLNDEEGNIKFSCLLNPKFYTLIDVNNLEVIDPTIIYKSMGFDIGGSLEFPITNNMSLLLDGRIPIVPGRLQNKVEYSILTEYSASIQSINNAETNVTQSKNTFVEKPYIINRPMKLKGTLELDAFNSVILLRGGLGFGFYRPFTKEISVYPEYILSGGINIANLLKVQLSTEYTDRIYKNQFTFGVNVRLIEIDTGISLQAANFAKSFTGTGIGAFVVVSMGF